MQTISISITQVFAAPTLAYIIDAFDLELMENVLEKLKLGQKVDVTLFTCSITHAQVPIYDFTTHGRKSETV